MYLKSLGITNFRSCLDTKISFQSDLTVLVGENNGGKSNIIDAIRLLTLPLNGRRDRYPEDDDLLRGSKESEFRVEGQYAELSPTVKGLLIIGVPDPTKDVAFFGMRHETKVEGSIRGRTSCWAGQFIESEPEHGSTDLIRHVDYLVYIPDYRIRDLNAADLDASRVIDATNNELLPARIQDILGPGVAANDGWYEKVHEFFCQTFEVVPDIQAHRDSQERTFVRQVGPVASVLANLEMTPFRLRFTGTAGSGKSLVARHFFARASDEGKRVLLTCFNRPLAQRFRERVPNGGYVDTFHGFCVEFLKDRGQVLDFADPGVWRLILELVTAEEIPDKWQFDALVVDEGQDFEQEWLDILSLFLSEDADILWLEDPGQNLVGKPSVATDGFVGYRCLVNYRSPESIARFIRNTLSFEFELGNDLPGMGAGVHSCDNPDDQPKIVTRVVRNLIKRGFSYDDIVIITCHGLNNSVFSGLGEVGGIKLRQFTGYDGESNQLWSEGQLTFESIYRFKGQESPAVILVDIDPQPDRVKRWERLLYCGMTRATVRLDLVVKAENPENLRFLDG